MIRSTNRAKIIWESPEHFEEQVGQRDLIQRVWRAAGSLGGLPLTGREGFSYREIAEALQEFSSRRCAVVSHVLVRPSNSSTPSLNRRDVDEVCRYQEFAAMHV